MKRPHTVLVQTAFAALLVAGGCATSAAPAPAAALETPGSAVTAEMIDEAFLYGYGIYEFARFATSGSTSAGRAVNVIGHRRVLSDHTHRNVTAPNMDTLYSSAILELSGGPVEVITPEAPDRYHSIAFMDMFTDNFAIIGTRNGGGHAARYWLAGPGWQGDVPAGHIWIIEVNNKDPNHTILLDAKDRQQLYSIKRANMLYAKRLAGF